MNFQSCLHIRGLLSSVGKISGKRCLSTLGIDKVAPRVAATSPFEHFSQMSSVLGKFATYPKKEFLNFIAPFVKNELVQQLNVFNDFSLLLRQPTLSAMKDFHEIRRVQKGEATIRPTDGPPVLSSQTIPRFLAYGQPGCGISTMLAQLAHYAGTDHWLIFPFCNAEKWLDRCVDLTPSNDYHQEQHRPHAIGDIFDFPSRSADWLNKFLKLNEAFLQQVKPVTTRDVAWTKADITPAGTPWTELISFATARTKYSTDCIGILLREMRTLCSKPDGPPCLLVVDGVNFLWCRSTRLKDKTLQVKVTVDRLAIVNHLRRALRGDWRHGVILTSLNIRGAWPTDREKYTPGYLLGKSGFECMDPFIPIHVENYTNAELDACLRFYAENHWLTNPAAYTPLGRAEIAFLSDNNPHELDKIVAEW